MLPSSESNSFAGLRRVLDVIGAMIVLIVTAPAMIAAAIAIRLTMGSPVLFRQERAGLRGRRFVLVKFRSMTVAAGKRDDPDDDAARLTALGRFLRTTSIDELPTLWNVLRGDMALVGPRPLPLRYVERYDNRQRLRLCVKPGVTGWAQVNGRNALSWEERFELDVWYVTNRTIRLDFRILLLTLTSLRRRDGISQPGHATMPEFTTAEPNQDG